MEDAIERAVERVIATMRDNLGEQLTIDDMARAARFSKFHFSRIFQRVTGVSPGRFLSALRLQQAKRLLISTSLNVADISIRVGYTSVGTFSSRFTRSVGLSPTNYRRLGGFTPCIPIDRGAAGAGLCSGSVHGTVWPARASDTAPIFIGLFPDRIPEGRPVSSAVVDRPGRFALTHVPEGIWYVLAHCVTDDPQARLAVTDEHALSVGAYGPVTLRRDTVLVGAELRLEPMRALHPPVLLALLDPRARSRVGTGQEPA